MLAVCTIARVLVRRCYRERVDYIGVEQARAMSGLRLVLTRDVPGPWGEAAKGLFQVKGVSFVAVEQIGGGPNEALRDWTGQTSAPVAAWNDEPPVWTTDDILFLAERLTPEPALVPADPAERALMFGLAHEISGREGLGWERRLCLFQRNLSQLPPAGPEREQALAFPRRYGYTAGAAAAAPARVCAILGLLRDQLLRQQEGGRRYLIGDRLSALDVLWATFATMLAPLPHELCPMSPQMRAIYGTCEPEVEAALDPLLLEHRDFMYREHLTTPLDF
jgi:glutathione S-transferase